MADIRHMKEDKTDCLNFAPPFVADGSFTSLLEESTSFKSNFKWCISLSELPSVRRLELFKVVNDRKNSY